MKSVISGSLTAIILLCAAGCAGPVVTQTGIAGPALGARIPLAIVTAPGENGDMRKLAQAAVEQALARQGHTIAADAALHMEIAVAERRAPVGVDHSAGAALSQAKQQRLLQSCTDRTHRLTVALYDPSRPGVTRAWAEEYHCKGTLAQSLPALADRLVATLENPAMAGLSQRKARD